MNKFNRIFSKLFCWTLTSALYNAVYWTCCYIKDWYTVEQSLHGEGFKALLKSYLKLDARVDWLGRVYGVTNPAINEKGEFDYNSMIFELDGVRTNNQKWVENWLYKQMLLVDNVFDVHKTGFFDVIDAKVEHVGPPNADNYLIVFDIASRKEMSRWWKKAAAHAVLYAVLVVGYIIL